MKFIVLSICALNYYDFKSNCSIRYIEKICYP